MASSSAHPNPHDSEAYQFDPQSSRGEQNTYLTDYETAAQAEHSDYPTEISDSQDLYSHSPAQTGSPETHTIYVPPPLHPPLQQLYNDESMYSSPQTPTQHPPDHAGYGIYMTPASQPPIQHPSADYTARRRHGVYHNLFTRGDSQTPTYPQLQPQYPNLEYPYVTRTPSQVTEYEQAAPASLFTQFSLHQPNQPFQPNTYAQQTSLDTPTSEALSRFVAPDPEASWSPVAQVNPESRKRRISEAESTVGFSHNKLTTELDGMGGGEGNQPPAKKTEKAVDEGEAERKR